MLVYNILLFTRKKSNFVSLYTYYASMKPFSINAQYIYLLVFV